MTLTNVRTAAQAVQRSFDETAEAFRTAPEYCKVMRVTADGTIFESGANLVAVTVTWPPAAPAVVTLSDDSIIMQVATPTASGYSSWIPPVPVRAAGVVRLATTVPLTVVYIYYTDLR